MRINVLILSAVIFSAYVFPVLAQNNEWENPMKYEWNKEKEKISFTMPQSDILYMAGVWQPTEKESQFTIITTVPNSSVSSVHDRMPLVLTPEEIQPWIQDWSTAERLLTKTPPLLEQRQEFEQLSIFDMQ